MPGFVVNNIGGYPKEGGGIAPADAEYYYTYTWFVESVFDDFNQRTRDILIHAKDMTLPAFVVNKETVLGGSVEYKFAKSISWDDVKITWYDTVGMIEILKRWRRSVWTQEDGLKGGGVYKKRTYQNQYIANRGGGGGGAADERDIRYRLEGSWPSVIRHGDLTYTNSDVKIVEVTVTYDWAEEDAP